LGKLCNLFIYFSKREYYEKIIIFKLFFEFWWNFAQRKHWLGLEWNFTGLFQRDGGADGISSSQGNKKIRVNYL
jgi:hypothetical protein